MSPQQCALVIVWIAFAIGVVYGALLGLGFHREDFAGGYGSWRRRLLRLGHIACFGLGLLCAVYLGSSRLTGDASWTAVGVFGLAVVSMPTVCALAAWRPSFRHVFVVPVLATLAGIGIALTEVLIWISHSSP